LKNSKTMNKDNFITLPEQTKINVFTETMQRTMIYGNSLPFDKLIKKIKQLNERINEIDW